MDRVEAMATLVAAVDGGSLSAASRAADAAVAAAISSAGITRELSHQLAAPVAAGALRLILRPFEPEPLPVHLVYASQSLLPQTCGVPGVCGAAA